MMIRFTCLSRPGWLFLLLLVVACFFATWCRSLDVSAQEQQQDETQQDSIDRDYSAELPRIKPQSPVDALRTFQVADGYRVELVVAEPEIVDPVAMTFDELGRMFVVEMRDYSEHDTDALGRVRLLEDRDRDGRYESSQVFAEGLSWPTAIIRYGTGVFVGAAPHIYYLPDDDHDGVADRLDIVFTGFGRSNVQGLMNSFRWGHDHRIHGATSSSGAEVIRSGESNGELLILRGRDFAFDPRDLSIEAVSGGGQHGLSFNRWGEKFVCANSNHIQFIVYDDRYLNRNPFVAALPARVDIAADGPQADVFRTSPVEPWRTVRTRLRRQGIVPGPVERGGLAAGYFTGATGVTLYRGDNWPEEAEHWAIIGDVGSNLVHRKEVKPQGVSYVATRIDKGSEFLTSSDVWFRPVQFANGPDGTLYVLDMYREVIEHPHSLPPVIKRHLDLDSGRDRGRIYRIVHGEARLPGDAKLGEKSNGELAELLLDNNGWTRETAARLLYQRQDRRVINKLHQLLRRTESAAGLLWVASTLDGLDGLTADAVLLMLNHPHPKVRQFSLTMAESMVTSEAAVLEQLLAMTDDDDARVRLQLAFSLGSLPNSTRRNRALYELVRRDLEEPYMRMAVHSSLAAGAGQVVGWLGDDEDLAKTPEGQELIRQLVRQIARQQAPEDVAALADWLSRAFASNSKIATLIIEEVDSQGGEVVQAAIEVATSGEASELLKARVNQAITALRDSSTAAEDRTALINDLRWGDAQQVMPILFGYLDAEQPPELQRSALQVLEGFTQPEVADELLRRWNSMTPSTRQSAMEVLLVRPAWTLKMIEAIEQGQLPSSALDAGRLRAVASHQQGPLRQRVEELLEQLGDSSRTEVIEKYRDALELAGDEARGRAVFEKQCANCHQVAGIGQAIGPNLPAMLARGEEAILTNVLDPNREVNPAYLSYALVTVDGRVHAGMIESESPTSLILRNVDGERVTLLRVDLESIQSTGRSLMPEGMEKDITVQQMADLLAFLKAAG